MLSKMSILRTEEKYKNLQVEKVYSWKSTVSDTIGIKSEFTKKEGNVL